MKKGFRGTGTVERVDFPNKGIAVTDDGDRVIVKNTIPGQKVEFVVNKVRHQRAEGRLMEVIEKSLWRQKSHVLTLECAGAVHIRQCLTKSSLI